MAQDLIRWIAAHTSYRAVKVPRIVLTDRADLSRRFYGPEHREQAPLQVEALYEHTTGTVYLCNCWCADDPIAMSKLLHELVHHVQDRNHADAPCNTALEGEAYQLQAQWLAARGVEHPYRAIGTDEFTVGVLASCFF